MLIDQLMTELAALNAKIHGLPERPPGEPGDIKAFAGKVASEAAAAADAASAAGKIPNNVIFVGPAADRFRGHAQQCSGVALMAAVQLLGAVEDLGQQAKDLARKQREYDDRKKALITRRDDVAAQIRSLG